MATNTQREFQKGDRIRFLDVVDSAFYIATLIGRDTGDGLWAVDVDPPFIGHRCASIHGPDSSTVQHHFENAGRNAHGCWLCEDEMSLITPHPGHVE